MKNFYNNIIPNFILVVTINKLIYIIGKTVDVKRHDALYCIVPLLRNFL